MKQRRVLPAFLIQKTTRHHHRTTTTTTFPLDPYECEESETNKEEEEEENDHITDDELKIVTKKTIPNTTKNTNKRPVVENDEEEYEDEDDEDEDPSIKKIKKQRSNSNNNRTSQTQSTQPQSQSQLLSNTIHVSSKTNPRMYNPPKNPHQNWYFDNGKKLILFDPYLQDCFEDIYKINKLATVCYYLEETECDYSLNFISMFQTNLQTDCQRKVCRSGSTTNTNTTNNSTKPLLRKYLGGKYGLKSSFSSSSTPSSSSSSSSPSFSSSFSLSFPPSSPSSPCPPPDPSTLLPTTFPFTCELFSQPGVFPPSWTQHEIKQGLLEHGTKILLSEDHVDYLKTRDMVHHTLYRHSILKIYKIVHPILFMNYRLWKNLFQLQFPNIDKLDEQYLFHGTNHGSIESIVKSGFKYRFNRVGNYGRGNYFAKDASYSIDSTYAVPEPGTGEQFLFLCRVCIGKSTIGTPNMVILKDQYQSASDSDDPKKQSIFVTFHDHQSYPEFLIVLKKNKLLH